MGVDDLVALGVRDVSGFLLRQRGLRRKTIAAEVVPGRLPGLLGRRGPDTAQSGGSVRPTGTSVTSPSRTYGPRMRRRVLAVIDRQSATGKRDYAMISTTARLGLRSGTCVISNWATSTGGREDRHVQGIAERRKNFAGTAAVYLASLASW